MLEASELQLGFHVDLGSSVECEMGSDIVVEPRNTTSQQTVVTTT